MPHWSEQLTMVGRRLPLVRSLKGYSRNDLRSDIVAGLTVGVVVVPQGLAYAMLAGLPPVYGLYASLLPTVLYVVFGSSRKMSVGPVAITALLVLAGVGAIAEPGSARYISLAIATAFFVGVIQILFGVFKLGFLVNFLSMPVIKGFTAAAAVIIGSSQLSHFLKISLPRSNHLDVLLVAAFKQLDQVHWPTVFMGMGALGLIILFRLIHRSIPGALLTVIAGIVLVTTLKLSDHGIAVVGQVPEGLPGFHMVQFSFHDARDLISLVFLLTFVSMIESIAIAKAIEGNVKYRIDPNQELIALGISKVVSSFFQAFPTTGSFSRSAVNADAGARTGIASFVSVFLVALTLIFLTPMFFYLPRVVLAAIIVFSVVGLFDVNTARKLWRAHRTDFYMMIATFLATLYLGILQGVLAGVILSLVLMIYRNTKPHVTILGRIPNTIHFRNTSRYPQAKESDDVLIVRFDAPLFFGNSNYFLETIEQFLDEKSTDIQYFILDASGMHEIDSSGAEALKEIIETLNEKGITFVLAGAIGPLRDRLYRSGLMQYIGSKHQFMDVNDAVLYTEGKIRSARLALQTNLGRML